MASDPFHGIGFSREPLDGEEAARHRHAISELERNWGPLQDGVNLARGLGVATAILAAFVKVGLPMLAIAAALGAWMKANGVL